MILFFITNLFLIIVPFVPPSSGSRTYEHLPYWVSFPPYNSLFLVIEYRILLVAFRSCICGISRRLDVLVHMEHLAAEEERIYTETRKCSSGGWYLTLGFSESARHDIRMINVAQVPSRAQMDQCFYVFEVYSWCKPRIHLSIQPRFYRVFLASRAQSIATSCDQRTCKSWVRVVSFAHCGYSSTRDWAGTDWLVKPKTLTTGLEEEESPSPRCISDSTL